MIKYNNTPSIVVEDNVLSPDLCEHIIGFANNKGLKPNLINRDGEYIQDDARTSEGIFLEYGDNKVLDGVIEAFSGMCGLSPDRLEPVSIQRYLPGQEYKPHYDGFLLDEIEEMPESSKIKEGGNRCVTMIAYLNDVSDGGGTVFPVPKADGVRQREVWHGARVSAAAARPPAPPHLPSPAALYYVIL